MDELLTQIDFVALKEAMAQGLTYGGDLFYRFQDFIIWKSSLLALTFLLATLTVFPIFKWIRKVCKERKNVYEPYELLYLILFLHVFTATGFMGSVIKVLQAILIPELSLIEYLK